MGVALKDLRGKVKRPIRVAKVCLDGELWARHDTLTSELESMRSQPRGKMGDSSEARRVAEELQQVEQAMRDAEVAVEFRGISTYQLAEIQARFPGKNPQQGWDAQAGAPALIAATAVEPTTEDEARELLEELHHAAADKLITTAWTACTGSNDVPFSVRASALISGSGSK